MGTIGDRIERRLRLIGAACFGVTSLVAAFSTSAEMLIVMRALLVIADATLAPSTLSLIRNMFLGERERQFAIGVWIASFSLGSAIGPLGGGVLLQYFALVAVFLPAVPVMVLLLVLGPALLPEYRDPNPGRIDLPSVVMSLTSVLTMVYGLKQVIEHAPGLRADPGATALPVPPRGRACCRAGSAGAGWRSARSRFTSRFHRCAARDRAARRDPAGHRKHGGGEHPATGRRAFGQNRAMKALA